MTDQVGSLYIKLEADVTQLKAELRKMRGQVDEEKKHFQGLQTAIAGAFTVGAAIKAASTVAQLAKIGAEAERTRQTFFNLGGSVEAVQELRVATRGMVDDVSAMQAATKFLAMGLAASTAEAAELAEVATQLGSAMSMDAGVAMADFAALLANQSIPRLDNFGISSGRVRARIAELQIETKGLSREQAFLTATMDEARKTMAKVGEQGAGTAADMQTMAAASQNVKVLMGEIVAAALAASGVMGVLNKALVEIQGTLETGKGLAQSAEAFKDTLKGLGAQGTLTKDQVAELSDAFAELRKEASRAHGSISLETQIRQIDELREKALDMVPSTVIDRWAVDLKAANEAARDAAEGIDRWAIELREASVAVRETANEVDALDFSGFATKSLPSFKAGMRALITESSKLPLALADAMSSDAIADAMRDMGVRAHAIMEDIESGLESIVEEGEQTRSDLRFRHNLDRLKAQQRYEQQYAALVTVGRTEDAESLQATFQQKEGMAGHQFAIDEQMLNRTMLIRKITRAKAYVAELTEQGDQIRRTFANELKSSKAFQELEIGKQGAILTAIFEGGSEQLRLEAELGEAMVKLSADAAAGRITNEIEARKAIELAWGGNIGAAQAYVDRLEDIYNNFEVQVPDLPTFDLGDIGGVGGGGAGRQIAETVTKPLAQAVDEIARSVAGAKQAMEDLIGFELGEGVEAGFDQSGKFVKLGITQFHGWLEADEGALKAQLDTIKEFLAPIRDLFSTINVNFAKIADTDAIAKASENLDAYIQLHEDLGVKLMDWLKDRSDEVKKRVKEAALLAADTKTLFSVIGIGYASLADTDAIVKAAGNLDAYVQLHEQLGIKLMDWLKDRSLAVKKQVAAAAPLAKDIKELFVLVNVDYAKLADTAVIARAATNLDAYTSLHEQLGVKLMDWLKDRSDAVKAQVAAAAELAEDIDTLFVLANVDYSKIADTSSIIRAATNLDAYTKLHEELGIALMDWLKDRSATVAEQVKNAGAIAEDVEKLFSLTNVDYSKLADTSAIVKARGNLHAYIQLHKDVGVELMDWLKDRSPEVTEQVSRAALLATDVKTLFDVLTIDPESIKSPDKGFADRAKAMAEGLEEALGLDDREGVIDVMERIRTRWGDALVNAAMTTELITSIFTGIGSVIASIRAAVVSTSEMGGSFVPHARALFNQLAHVAALTATVPSAGSTAAAGAAAGGGGVSETTINLMIGDDIIARITGQVIGRLRIQRYTETSNAGARPTRSYR